MSHPHEPASTGLLLKLSVPTSEPLRIIAADIAAKVAEFLKSSPNGESVTAAVESAASQATAGGTESEIALEFRLEERELRIEARCGSRTSEVRCPLHA
jgi:hypothetical protein